MLLQLDQRKDVVRGSLLPKGVGTAFKKREGKKVSMNLVYKDALLKKEVIRIVTEMLEATVNDRSSNGSDDEP